MSDVYQMVTDRILELLQRGVVPWRKPWSTGLSPQNLVSKKPYRGINHFLLRVLDYASPWWLTFKQAKELGGHVRKGEKGTQVVFWKILEYEKETDEDNALRKIPFLRHYTVFNAEQCEGIDAPAPQARQWFDNERIEAGERVIAEMPNRPSIMLRDIDRACYNKMTDTVMAPLFERFEKPGGYYGTLFHELAHSTGHATRLARPTLMVTAAFGSEIYSKEELVAEMASSFLCHECGFGDAVVENNAAYLNGWIRALRGDSRLVVAAASYAQKAADYILNRLEA